MEPPLHVCALNARNVSPPSLFDMLDDDCRPIAVNSRKQPEENSKFIAAETPSLLADGIIGHSISPWRAQVIDYSQTINRYTKLDAFPLPDIEEMIKEIAKYSVYTTVDLRSAYHQVHLKPEDKPYTAFESFGVTNGVSVFQHVMHKITDEDKLMVFFAYFDNVTICGCTQEEHDDNLDRFFKC